MIDLTAEKTDLSTPQAQALFKGMQRVSLITNIVMGVVAVLITAISIWASTVYRWDMGWAEITFYVLIASILAYFVFVAVWEILSRRKFWAIAHGFIAEGFYSCRALLDCGDSAEFEIYLAGDCLVVMRVGCGEYVKFDLSPVKSYSTVCSCLLRYAKNFIRDYYYLAAVDAAGAGFKAGAPSSVVLRDKVGKKVKNYTYVSDGKPVADCSKKYYIKHGIIG